MQIHGFTSPQTLQFTFSSESQRNALLGRLTQGQTLEAAVLKELSDGRFAIRFFGHTLVAESHLALSPGARVQARVEPLGPPLVLTLTGKTGSEETSLRDALRSLALPNDDLNRSIVRGLIVRGHTVDRNQVQALRDLLGGLQGTLDLDNAEALEAVITRALFLQDQGLPVTPDTLAAYLTHLPPGILGGLLESLTDLLRSLHSPALPQADRLADRIRQAIPELGSLTPETLRTLLTTLGPDLEGRLVAWLAAGKTGLPEGLEDTLKLALLKLQSQLEALDSDTSLNALRSRVQETLQLFDTLQAANLPTHTREALHFQIPCFIGEEQTTADLQIFYQQKEGKPEIDPENLHLTLALHLNALGPVRLDLSIAHQRASCRVYADTEEKVTFLQGASNELKAGLEKCGYTVAEVACRITQHTPSDSHSEIPPTVGVDFRA